MRTAFIALLLLCSSALAQDTVVTDTSIKVGTMLTCPRFAALYPAERVLKVPAETTFTLPANFDYDVIEYAGTLKISRDYDTAGKVIVIQGLPGGSFDCGTASDPVLRKVDIQIKDSPLLCGTDGNLGPDPEQFGNGILVFGEWKSYGRKLDKTWTTMQPVAAGATTLMLTDAVNWQVGDELLIPDTRLQYYLSDIGLQNRGLRYESPVRIAAINGNAVTLNKPLDFEHKAANGQLPYVANATRNIVIRSENPNGVRGHTMFMGTAHVSLYYTAFLDLGRTRPESLDSFDSHTMHIGTNQIARYGGPHWHHVHGHADAEGYTGRLVGCYGYGSDTTKWFCVQHGTHDLLITDTVTNKFVGAGFTTEDGFEVRGTYLRDMAMHCRGNGTNGKFNVLKSQRNAPGADGAGFWFHGSKHIVDYCVSIANSVGYSAVHMEQVEGRLIPSEPGGMNDTPLDVHYTAPLSFTNDKAVNCRVGIETWRTPGDWTATNFAAINCWQIGVLMGDGEGGSIYLVNPALWNDWASYDNDPLYGDVRRYLTSKTYSSRTFGIHSSAAYTGTIRILGGSIVGFGKGISDAFYISVEGTEFSNATRDIGWDDFKHFGRKANLKNLRFTPLLPAQEGGPYNIIVGQGGNEPLYDPNFDTQHAITYEKAGQKFFVIENAYAPADAITMPELVNAKAVPDGVVVPPTNSAPVVSAITPTPADVDPATLGVQEYVGPVTYSFTASDSDGDPLTIKVFYSANGNPRQQYNGPVSSNSWTFTYSQPVNYTWTVQADDGKGGVTESSLAVQVIAKPVDPPPPSNLEQRVLYIETFLRNLFKGF